MKWLETATQLNALHGITLYLPYTVVLAVYFCAVKHFVTWFKGKKRYIHLFMGTSLIFNNILCPLIYLEVQLTLCDCGIV